MRATPRQRERTQELGCSEASPSATLPPPREQPMPTGLVPQDAAGAWRAILERVAPRVPSGDLAALLHQLRPVRLTPSELCLEAPNTLVLSCVTEHYLALLRQVATTVLGPRLVQLDIARGQQGELFPELLVPRADLAALASQAGLDPRHSFATFVVGASNQFAHAAARAVARRPGTHYNPLFLYGGVGLGKTHLISAVGYEILRRSPGARVRYLSCDAFMNALIASLRRDRMEEFKERFRAVDVLILDDVQQLAGRERTQEEFFHTFNALHEHGRQIVLAADSLPRDIPKLEERLRNRFEWGLIADIQPPDIETRVAIVERKAELERIPVPPEVALLLAEQLVSNVRELEGCLRRLGAHASLARQPITVDFARQVLETLQANRPSRITFEQITQAVCAHWALRPEDLQSSRRNRHIARPRQVAMYLSRRLLGASLPRLGELFGRDHTTVLHAIREIERRLKDDVALQGTVQRLEAELRRPTPA